MNEPPVTQPRRTGSLNARYQIASDRVRIPEAAQESMPRPTSPWVVTIAVILLLGTLYIASSLFVPFAIAILAFLTLRPAVTQLCRCGLGQTMATTIVITGCFLIVATVSTLLYDPLQKWLANAPESVSRLREQVDGVAEPITTVDRAEESLDAATSDIRNSDAELKVQIKKPNLADSSYLINKTGHVIAFIGAIAVLTFFMLSSGDDLLNRILTVMPDETRRDETLKIIGKIQDNVGTYLSQITLINTGLAITVSIVMWAVGMPTPILWGAMAGLLNFIPYIGPLGGTAIVLIAAATAFDSFPRALATAAAFWMTTAIEGQFITPIVVGKTLKVGSLLVLTAVAFWGFMWGIPGIFLAIPLVISMREIFSNFEATYPLAAILGEDPCRPGQDCEPIQEDQPIADAATK